MQPLAAILSLLTGVAGWFYLFYSRAADGLSGIEEHAINLRRARLRRVGGFVMLVLAVLLYLGFYGVDPDRQVRPFIVLWLMICALIALLVLLALADVRLTLRLRRRRLLESRFDPTRLP